MAINVREVVVTIVVETNKATHQRLCVLRDDEEFPKFKLRVAESIEELIDEARAQ